MSSLKVFRQRKSWLNSSRVVFYVSVWILIPRHNLMAVIRRSIMENLAVEASRFPVLLASTYAVYVTGAVTMMIHEFAIILGESSGRELWDCHIVIPPMKLFFLLSVGSSAHSFLSFFEATLIKVLDNLFTCYS